MKFKCKVLFRDSFAKYHNMELIYRKPTLKEIKLIKLLINISDLSFPEWEKYLLVCEMNDGKMGSLTLMNDIQTDNNLRVFGKQISEYQYVDSDGVDVIVSLNTHNNNQLYELDIWKTVFSPLNKFPYIQ